MSTGAAGPETAETPADPADAPTGASDASPGVPQPAARGEGRFWQRGPYRVAAVALAVLVFAVGAGVLVARTSGTRTAGQSLSGDIRQTVRQRLDQCLQLSGVGQLLEAVKCYDGVITDQPSSAEAYTYRAWTLIRTRDSRLWPASQQNLDHAVSLDPSYPDARVFRAVLYRDQGRVAEARADLGVFDALNPPQIMRDLVDQMGLRASLESPAASPTTSPSAGASPSTSAGQ
jgi:tetratricopeptide (TPR) repeat protein